MFIAESAFLSNRAIVTDNNPERVEFTKQTHVDPIETMRLQSRPEEVTAIDHGHCDSRLEGANGGGTFCMVIYRSPYFYFGKHHRSENENAIVGTPEPPAKACLLTPLGIWRHCLADRGVGCLSPNRR